MRHLLPKLLLFLAFVLFSSQSSPVIEQNEAKKKVFIFEIQDEIGPPSWRKTKLAIDRAIELKVDLIVLRLNTYGGIVDAADSMRTKILNCPIPVYVLIENNAASAGALISLACDSIYMTPGATIGAATVVNAQGEVVPDKYQSYMRKKMRATAEQNGRNPDIAEAMVDPDKEVPGISEKGKVLTFTVNEAIANGFCEAKLQTVEQVIERAGFSKYDKIKHVESTMDILISFLINPAVSGLLIMLIIGGIYFELQSPGIGFPILAAGIAAALYFAPLYMEGLAENWEIVLFILGLALIALEIFVIPGFGVAGISGILLTLAGLILSMLGNVGFDFEPIQADNLITAILVVLISSALAIFSSVFIGIKFLQSNFFEKLVLNSVQSKEMGYVGTNPSINQLVGKQGKCLTVLRSSGKVYVDGDIYDATAIEGYIEKDALVEVLRVEGNQLIVAAI